MNQANNPNQGRQQKPDQPNQQPGQGSQTLAARRESVF
jgi:hypothetical protein